MNAAELVTVHQETVKRAAQTAYRLVKSWGYDRDDCEQEGYVALLELAKNPRFATLGSVTQQTRYLNVVVRRRVIRVARGAAREATGPLPTELIDPVDPAAVVDLADLIHSAAATLGDAYAFLQHRVLDGLTWEETRKLLEWSNDRMSTARVDAADWLLAQYEGRATA